MKKNLLSIVILALLVVNIALTALMMLSVMKNEQATGKIVSDIATALSIEMDKGDGKEDTTVSLADTQVYDFEENMTIALKPDEGETKTNYLVCKVSLSMDTKHEDYSKYNESFDQYIGLIKSQVNSVVSSYTLTEAQISQDKICEEVLTKIQDMFDSDFIYKVSFSEYFFG